MVCKGGTLLCFSLHSLLSFQFLVSLFGPCHPIQVSSTHYSSQAPWVRRRLAQSGRTEKRTQKDPERRRCATASLRFSVFVFQSSIFRFPISSFCLLPSSLPFRLRALPDRRTRTLPPNKLLSPLDGKPAHTSYSANQEDKGYEYSTNGPPRTVGRFLDRRSLDRSSSRLMMRIKA